MLAPASASLADHHEDAKHAAKEAHSMAQNETLGRAERAEKYTDSKARNAWLDSKLESAYLFNRHLNNFAIDTSVVDGTANLSGSVESEIDRELAEQVALNIEGITAVENELTIDREARKARVSEEGERSFAQRLEDITTTAAVDSEEEKALAGSIAENTDDVPNVRNALTVSKGKAPRARNGRRPPGAYAIGTYPALTRAMLDLVTAGWWFSWGGLSGLPIYRRTRASGGHGGSAGSR